MVKAVGFSALACVCALLHAVPANSASDLRIQAFETGLRPGIQYVGEKPVRWSLRERMRHYGVPGVSIAVIRDGKLAWARGYGVRAAGGTDRVDSETVFSVGSLSKVAAAATTLRLVDAGTLDLDKDVSIYLKRWQLPKSPHTTIEAVTLRGLLSHSAGVNVPGFPDFLPGEPVPTLLDTLNGTPPAKTERLTISYVPGTEWRYSGGGIQIEQLVIEDVTGVGFVDAARKHVFEPLGMARSTFENPLPESHGNIALAHDDKGGLAALPRGYETFPELAASGLWSTPKDYAKLVIALLASYRGQTETFLSADLGRQVMNEVGVSAVGLGPFLDGNGMNRRFFHTGANDHYRAWMEGNLAAGNGMIVFTNGSNGSLLYTEIRRAIEAAEDWPKTEEILLPRVHLSGAELRAIAGTYVVEQSTAVGNTRTNLATSPVVLKVLLVDGALHLAEDNQPHGVRMLPADHSHFVNDGNASYSFDVVHGYDGKPSKVIFRRGAYSFEARRIH